MTKNRRPLAKARKGTSRAKLLFRTVGQALSLTDLIIVRLYPDLRGRSVVPCKRACSVFILEKANQS